VHYGLGRRLHSGDFVLIPKLLGIIAFIIAFIYLISPIDFIPDIIPVIGWIDDVVALFIAFIVFLKSP